ncbi:MAG: DUF3597 domain-containing protein [Burkholderiales bacterium]
MGIFSKILDKLRHHGAASASQPASGQQTAGSAQQQAQPSTQQQAQPSAQTGQQGASQVPIQSIDIEAVLVQLASTKDGGGNYRESIVDLLKLLDLDSSLAARKELAQEVNVNAGVAGSAEQNIALHKAVMRKVAENGGKVPESMKH